MRNINILILLISLAVESCTRPDRKMEEKTAFTYSMSVTAPREYPVKVYIGFLNNTKGFISAIPVTGTEGSGWTKPGSDGGMSANQIPSHMDLTWLSYTEKKFWKVDTELPAEKIKALFQEGYTDLDGKGAFNHQTYDHICFGVAPGGIVVVWLQGRFFSTEVGRYQAKDTLVKKDNFRPIPKPEETEEQFYETFFNNNTTPETRENLKKYGFPYGIWDKYRSKYNWRLRVQFYKPGDKQTLRYNTYLNGEQEVIYEKELAANTYLKRPAPYSMNISFADQKAVKFNDLESTAEIQFDEKEVMAAFEELAKTNKDQQIELLVKVGFQYKGLQLKLVTEKKEIPLLKSKIDMHSFK